MSDPGRKQRLDAIAREAARLIGTGRVTSMKDALHAAADALGYPRAPLPGAGRVRKHAQAMAMQAMGEAEYRESQREVLRVAEELMSSLVQGLNDAEPILVGRAAEGKMDAGVTLHVRLYTNGSVTEIAATLVEFGYEEPQFDTVQTMYGPVNRLLFAEEGLAIVLTRCPRSLRIPRDADMFNGGKIANRTIETLRRRLDEAAEA